MSTLNAVYSDSRGSEPIQFENDGQSLRTLIRGIAFEGPDFDALTPAAPTELFRLNHGDLCGCMIVVEIPIRLVTQDGPRSSIISAEIVLGAPAPNGGIDREEIRLGMPEFGIVSPGESGWFEDEMLALVKQLPPGLAMEACITCGLSDYGPSGHGSFGWLMCFRAHKADYRRVSSKGELFQLMSHGYDLVQETYRCDEFESRPKGRGYRG